MIIYQKISSLKYTLHMLEMIEYAKIMIKVNFRISVAYADFVITFGFHLYSHDKPHSNL